MEQEQNKESTGFISVLKRELSRMISRPIYLIITMLIPLSCFLFFITLLDKGLPEKMPIAVIDLDNTSNSRMLARQVKSLKQVDIKYHLESYSEAVDKMQEGKIYAFMLIPDKFQSDILAGRQPELTFYTQSAHLVVGSLIMRDLTTISATIAGGVNLTMRQAKGQSIQYAIAQVNPIGTDLKEVGNSTVNYSVYLTTAMIPGLLQLMIIVVTVFSIGGELKYKTSREWMGKANNSIIIAILGKLLPYTIIFISLMFFANTLMFKFLGFPYLGIPRQMIFASVLFVLAHQALGLIIIGLVPVLRLALSVCAVLGTLAISFSGVTFPIEAMYPFIQGLSSLFPLRHYFVIYASQALKGMSIGSAWGAYMALLAFIVASFFVLTRLKKALLNLNYPED